MKSCWFREVGTGTYVEGIVKLLPPTLKWNFRHAADSDTIVGYLNEINDADVDTEGQLRQW